MSAEILLIDDDPVMRELAEAKLREAGYNVEIATNGSEGLEKLKATPIDLVISDLEMPVMDGFQLVQNIRAERSIADTPVIVITASDHPDAVDRVFSAGATSFLAKPINWTLFNQSVKFVLRASQDQQSLKIARDQAEAGAKFKDALMSVMSHELRTPLNAIIGFGQLLGTRFDEQNDHLHKEYADYIVGGGRRLLNTVSDMLLASDARSGPIALNETDSTVKEIVDSAVKMVEANTSGAITNLEIKLQDDSVEVCCDRNLMSRALGKLIENAIKFSQRDVRIVVGTATTKSGGVAILVRDNGPGIDAEKLETIGAPFTQSDMSLRRSNEGLGLGLPMVKAIAHAHSATFKLDSKIDGGTQVIVVLPANRVCQPSNSKKNAA